MHLTPSTAWAWLIACAVVILLFPLATQFGNLKGKLSSFRTWVWAIALLGIVAAGFMPFIFDADIAYFEVQPLIFFITGTLLGVLFLGEFHRLSSLDKQEHTHRVHAERRTRYSKAVEQLAYPNPAVRASAIGALASLVDEWLADEQLSVEARQKEGQVIVNTLCAYVRSPFSRAFKAEAFESDAPPANYAGDFATDLAAFRGEQDVRRSIFVEMSKRSSTLTENEKGEVAVVPGAWSGFEFDFSRAVVFYPLSNLTIENADFASATFYGPADFSGTTFRGDTSFSAAQFTADASFHGANFTGEADFSDAVFSAAADFAVASFEADADFSRLNTAGIASFTAITFDGKAVFTASTFHDEAHFAASVFNRPAVFSDSLFGGAARFAGIVTKQSAMFSNVRFASAADFSGASFTQYEDFGGARFDGDATFSRASFIALPRTRYEMDFPQGANFGNATFAQDADFSKATFTAHVGFYKATFARAVSFNGASFEGAYFADATFGQGADFRQTSFAYVEPSFEALERRLQRARFSAHANPQDYQFEARPESPHGFSCGEAQLLNRTFILPLGAVLYDPGSWDEEKQDYTRISEPAQ